MELCYLGCFSFGSNIEKLSICNLVVLGSFFWVNFATNLSPKIKIKFTTPELVKY